MCVFMFARLLSPALSWFFPRDHSVPYLNKTIYHTVFLSRRTSSALELLIPYNRPCQYLIGLCNSLMSLKVPCFGTSSEYQVTACDIIALSKCKFRVEKDPPRYILELSTLATLCVIATNIPMIISTWRNRLTILDSLLVVDCANRY